jgi:hypothetical protein
MLTNNAKARLERVIERITAEPNCIYMGAWYLRSRYIQCSTVCCIAGWIVADELEHIADIYLIPAALVSTKARVLLDMDCYNVDATRPLFLSEYFPQPFRSQLGHSYHGSEDYARVVAARIRFFIDTDGTDDPKKIAPPVSVQDEELVCV